MMLTAQIIHALTIAICTAITGLSVTIAQGITSKASFDALNRQPAAKSDISRATLLALALIETSALLGFLSSILLLVQPVTSYYPALAQLGIIFAVSIPGIFVGLATAMPAASALISIARQPFLSKKIMNFMLLTQSLIQTALIFGFIVALIIRAQSSYITNSAQALALIGAGMAIGIGSIGPAIGMGKLTQTACESIGINKSAYNKLLSFTVISQAIVETPVIFASIIAFWLASIATSVPSDKSGLIYLAVAIAIAIGTIGPGISSGKTAAAACRQIALNPAMYSIVSRASMIAQGIIDTCAIYAFIIALTLIL